MPVSNQAIRSPAYPWEPQSAGVAKAAMATLTQTLLHRVRSQNGVHPESLMCAAGALTGFAALNAALDQGETLALRRDLVAPGSLLLHRAPNGDRFLFGSWINAYLFWGYGLSHPLQQSLVNAANLLGEDSSPLRDFRTMEARVAHAVGTPEFGAPPLVMGRRPAASPRALLEPLWPIATQILSRPPPRHLANEMRLAEAHWPILLAAVVATLVARLKSDISPIIAAGIAMESAIIGSKLDPEVIQPGLWRLEPGPTGLQIRRGAPQRLDRAVA